MEFDEGDGRQLLAELLQHDHALQQSHVVHAATEAVGDESRGATYRPTKGATRGAAYLMPSGSRPSNLFLTSSSFGVKSGIRWILSIRSPTT